MKAQPKAAALCIDRSGYRASLILGKVYRILPDPTGAEEDLVRIVDESGDDYTSAFHEPLEEFRRIESTRGRDVLKTFRQPCTRPRGSWRRLAHTARSLCASEMPPRQPGFRREDIDRF
jgi:hypothetical protein